MIVEEEIREKLLTVERHSQNVKRSIRVVDIEQ